MGKRLHGWRIGFLCSSAIARITFVAFQPCLALELCEGLVACVLYKMALFFGYLMYFMVGKVFVYD
jgi:hypothetical protein